MEEIITMIFDNIYEILLGVGIVTATVSGRVKTAEQLKAKREKLIAKKEKRLNKEICKCEKLGKELNELKEQNK